MKVATTHTPARRLALVLVFCTAAAVATACRPAVQSVPTRPAGPAPQVLVLSDLHFDPFSDPALVGALQGGDVSGWRSILAGSARKALSPYGSDTNYPLLQSALAAMQRAVPGPDVVLIAGDFMAHGFQANFKKACSSAIRGFRP